VETIPEFGIKREGEIQVSGGCAVIFDPVSQQYAVGKDIEGGLIRLFSGNVKPGEDVEKGVLREVVEESGLHDFVHVEKIAQAITHYYNRLKDSYRGGSATCMLGVLKSTDLLPLQLEAHEKFVLGWAAAEEILSNWESRNENKDFDHWIYFLNKAVRRAKELGYDKTSNLS
jgi:hypothetical protein